jgi:hypothetical protein
MDGTTTPEACGCPGCAEDPDGIITSMLAGATDLIGDDDPLAAELTAAMFVAMIDDEPDPDGVRPMSHGLIPQLAAQGGAEALALLTAIAAVAPPSTTEAATTAVTALANAGVPQPKWVDEIIAPLAVTDCWRLDEPNETVSVYAVGFQRAGRAHGILTFVDHTDCGAAEDIVLLDGAEFAETLDRLATRLEATRTRLDPADLRWHLEQALDVRAVHDEVDAELDDDPDDDLGDDDLHGLPPGDDFLIDDGTDLDDDLDADDDGPDYPVVAALLRARLATLPASDRPPARHHDDDLDPDSTFFETPGLPALAGMPAGLGRGPVRSAPDRKLPPKRKKSQGPAPVYRLGVQLVGSEPPIRRQVEVVGDTTLETLHHVVQLVFAWTDDHLHMFETPYGEFAPPGNRTGHRSERKVTLEQVAPAVGDTISYRYDFGDDWTHEITVEAVTDRDPTVNYPRCTGGERAAPPEDCGGVWGYTHLVEVLADPSHPEHADQREWLGLDDDQQASFDPQRFDVDSVNRRLTALR